MKWDKKKDRFILTRKEVNDILDYIQELEKNLENINHLIKSINKTRKMEFNRVKKTLKKLDLLVAKWLKEGRK